MTEKRLLKVFLSYASQDRAAVRELSRRLATEGWIDPWLDVKKLLPGQDWRLQIQEAVETSDIVIICLSTHSVTKEGYVQKELRYAREIALEKPDETIFLIPLRLDECNVPRGLRFYQWVDYFGEKKDEAYKALIESLKLRYDQKLKIEEEEHARREKEDQERETAEKAAREKTEREIAGKAETEKAEKKAVEKTKPVPTKPEKKAEESRIFKSIFKKQLDWGKIKPYGLVVMLIGTVVITFALGLPDPFRVTPIVVGGTPTHTQKLTTMTITPVLPAETMQPNLIVTETTTPTSTPISMEWRRINSLNFIKRDEVTSLVIDPSDSDIMYVGTRNAGIYMTKNGGISWEPASQGLALANIESLAIDPLNPRNLYAGTGEGDVYKTKNWADTWDLVLDSDSIWSSQSSMILVDQQNPNHIYYSNELRLFESLDQGESWGIVYENEYGHTQHCPYGFDYMAINPFDANMLAAIDSKHPSSQGCPATLYLSYDGGKNWQPVDESMEEYDVDSPSGLIVFDHLEGRNVYAQVYDALFRSSDKGISWNRINPVPRGLTCDALSASPTDLDGVYCVAGPFVYYSSNAGNSWQILHVFDYPPTFGGFVFSFSASSPKTLFRGDDGMLRSTNGGTQWEYINNGLGGRALELFIDPATSSWYLYNTKWIGPLYKTSDRGKNWELVMNEIEGQGYAGLAVDSGGETLYRFRTAENKITRSQDGGNNWKYSIAVPISHLNDIYAHPSQPGVVFISGNDYEYQNYLTFVSYDYGTTWSEIQSLRHSPDSQDGLYLKRIYFHPMQNNVYYSIPYVHIDSMEDYQNWSKCGTVIDASVSITATRFAIAPVEENDYLYLATNEEGILVSDNDCKSWLKQNTGLETRKINSVVVSQLDSSIVYAGTDNGFYISFSRGKAWNKVNDGLLGATKIYSIAIDPNSPSDVYATTSYGIFKLESK